MKSEDSARPGSRIRFRRAVAVATAAGLVLVGLGATGCATTSRTIVRATEVPLRSKSVPAQGPETDRSSGVHHTVRKGQTLWRIARTYQVPLDELIGVNRIDDPASLPAGQSLWIPRATRVLDVPTSAGSDSARTVPVGSFGWPVPDGRVLSYFGAPRKTHTHKGVDIGGRPGQPVLASRDGQVIYSDATMRGYGKTVILDHGDDLRTLYAHNSRLLVRVGDRVEQGQPIARVGQTGNASTDHCHFELRRKGAALDPLPYLERQAENRR